MLLTTTAAVTIPASLVEIDAGDNTATDLTLVDGIFADCFESGATGGWSAATA